MRLNTLETHDRYELLKKEQSNILSIGADECLKKNPLSLALQSRSPYVYMFAHPRTMEDGRTKKMLWQPRLSKPKAQTNSYLFRAISGTDNVEICWLLPPRELWGQYSTGKVTESDLIAWSINAFEYNRNLLDKVYEDDFSEEQIKNIYRQVAIEMDEEKRIKSLYPTQDSEGVFLTSTLEED
jgi:hypothetical protein